MNEDKFSDENQDMQNITRSFSANEPHLNGFEKWVLSMDKYIDVDCQRKAIYMAFGIGIIAFLLLTWLTHTGRINALIEIIIMVGAGVWLMLLITINNTAEKTDRHLSPWERKKVRFGCRCSKEYLPIYRQKQWIKDRFEEHYTCVVYPFIAWFLIGFFICNLIIYLCNHYLLKFLSN